MMNGKLIVGTCALFIALICCHKENSSDYKSSGLITGPDVRMCACCGGWFIQIDSTTYEFDTLPDNSKINLETESFPIYVKLDWQLAGSTACPANKIIIKRIKKDI
jgi:hypothetical protein